MVDDVADIPARYARRTSGSVYSMLRNEVHLAHSERFMRIARLLRERAKGELCELKLVDVGCGTGGNLLDFLRLGFKPHNLVGLELLEDRALQAQDQLPSAIQVVTGDAAKAPIDDGSIDIVFQSVVFSSLLTDSFQEQLAATMWRWVKPGGAILWYDFIYDNPKNPDVRGVALKRVKVLFPEGKIITRKVTLAPPISRRVGSLSPLLHNMLNLFPILRTHLLIWIEK